MMMNEKQYGMVLVVVVGIALMTTTTTSVDAFIGPSYYSHSQRAESYLTTTIGTVTLPKQQQQQVLAALMETETTTTTTRIAPLHLSDNHNNEPGSEERSTTGGGGWRTLASNVGTILKDLGGKTLDVVKEGMNKAKEWVTTNSSNLVQSTTVDTTYETSFAEDDDESITIYDTEDEDMFHSILGKNNYNDEYILDSFLRSTSSGNQRKSLDVVVQDAQAMVQQDELTASLLGPSVTCAKPFQQSSSTTIQNGIRTKLHQASFEVWGPLGHGIATVTSNNDRLTQLELEVKDQLYELNVGPSKSSSSSSSTFTSPKPNDNINPEFNRRSSEWDIEDTIIEVTAHNENKDDDDVIEVEILDGIRHPTVQRDRIVDVEILDKTFL